MLLKTRLQLRRRRLRSKDLGIFWSEVILLGVSFSSVILSELSFARDLPCNLSGPHFSFTYYPSHHEQTSHMLVLHGILLFRHSLVPQ